MQEGMMKALLVLLCLALGCAAPACDHVGGRSQSIDPYGLRSDVQAPSVRITIEGGGHGSGVVYWQGRSSALILTAAHVVEGSEGTPIVAEGVRSQATARTVYLDAEADVAVLETAPIWHEIALVAADQDWTLHNCGVFGYPLDTPEGRLTMGRIQPGKYYIEDQWSGETLGPFLFMSADAYFGNSGGGIFVYDRGRWRLLSVALRLRYDHGTVVPSFALGADPAAVRLALKMGRMHAGGGQDD